MDENEEWIFGLAEKMREEQQWDGWDDGLPARDWKKNKMIRERTNGWMD